MMIKVAVSDCFKLKMIPSFRSVFFPEKQEIHYIGGTDILPLPLSSEEEGHAISLLGGGQDEEGKKLLIEHNLRLVVYIAKKFDNTGVGVEDLISIGTIGLIKAIPSIQRKISNLPPMPPVVLKTRSSCICAGITRPNWRSPSMNRSMLTGMEMSFFSPIFLELKKILFIVIWKPKQNTNFLGKPSDGFQTGNG